MEKKAAINKMLDSDNNLKRWMEQLPNYIRQKVPIIYLAIPGSSNSMSFGLRPDRPTTGSAGWMPRYFNYLSPNFTLKWFKTQNSCTSKQLNSGVRYFDLKICKTKCTKPSTSFFFANTFTSVSLFEPLLAIFRFLKQHPKELVILDFREFCDLTENDHVQLQKFIYSSLNYFLIKSEDIKLEELTLYNAEQLKKSLIVIYRHKARISAFWSSDSWKISFPNTDDIKSLPKIITNLLTERSSGSGNVARFIINPTVVFIAENITKSMKQIAVDVHKEFSKWIINQFPGKVSDQPKVNVITIDFFDLNGNDFCNKVIKLNELLTKSSNPTRKETIQLERYLNIKKFEDESIYSEELDENLD